MANSAQLANIKIPTTGLGKATTIEDVLFSKGLITQKQIDFIRSEVKRRQEPAEKIISAMGWVTDEDLAQGRAQVMGVPYAVPDKKPISPEVLGYLPEDVAKRFTVIPIGREKDVLEVAMVDPLDLQVIEFIEKKSGLTIKPYLATEKAVNRAIADH